MTGVENFVRRIALRGLGTRRYDGQADQESEDEKMADGAHGSSIKDNRSA
jgi:hypothetical protein